MRDERADPSTDVRRFLAHMASEVPAAPADTERAVRRAKRRLAITSVVAALAIALAIPAGMLLRDAFRPAPAPIPLLPTVRAFTVEDLPRLVLDDEQQVVGLLGPGVGAQLRWFEGGPIRPAAIASRIFVDGRHLQRAGMLHASMAAYVRPSGAVRDRGTTFVSMAMLFPDAEGTARGLAIFAGEGRDLWADAREVAAGGLGADGIGLEGHIGGSPAISFVWRTGNVLLFVASQGQLTPGRMRAAADAMQERADTLTSGGAVGASGMSSG